MQDDKPISPDAWAPFNLKAAAGLPFRWQDLPTEDCGSARPNFTPAETFIVGGRKTWLDEFIQYNTYAGMLCGRPMHPELEILRAIQKAAATFPGVKAKPILVPPKVRFSQDGARPLPWAIVPPVATIALIHDGCDIALVVWFQDAFGLPTDRLILDALEALDLKVHGVEWEP